jgi:DNA polymerase-3 subunit delta'
VSHWAKSADDRDPPHDPPHPRSTAAFFGHEAAERMLLECYRSGRCPHAWLFGGPRGIGKATLAYRFARFVLAHPDPTAHSVAEARTLALDASHPVCRRVGSRAHPDLLVLEREENDEGDLRSAITVEQTSRAVNFFGSTAGEGGWRVCIVDSADELRQDGANKLLKILEEPPRRSLFLMISHAPGRLLATLRSRCHRLTMRSLNEADVARAAAHALSRDPDDDDVLAAAAAAEGSVARAITLLGGSTLRLRQQTLELLQALPETDPRALHALGEALGRAGDDALTTFADAVRWWLSTRLTAGISRRQLVRAADAWDRVNQTVREAEILHLDRKPVVFSVFALLAEAVRD